MDPRRLGDARQGPRVSGDIEARHLRDRSASGGLVPFHLLDGVLLAVQMQVLHVADPVPAKLAEGLQTNRFSRRISLVGGDQIDEQMLVRLHVSELRWVHGAQNGLDLA
jgi:hypothetical protein